MELDVLSLDVDASQWGAGAAKTSIRAKVVPNGHDTLRIGSGHVFAQHNFNREFQRIEAQVWISDNADHFRDVSALLPDALRPAGELHGYACAAFPRKDGDEPHLSFALYVDEATLSRLLVQLRHLEPGSARIDLWIEGLKFGLPDEEIWEAPTAEHSTHYLPLRHFAIRLAKLRTTRGAIREADDAIGNREQADSDNLENRRAAIQWMKDDAQRAVEQNPDPSLMILRQCRLILAALLLCAMVLILRQR